MIALTLALFGRSYGTHSLIATITDPRVNESSGIAPSRQQVGCYYTHNDSGDTARFFRIKLDGSIQGEWSLNGVTATDWEDIATARAKGKNWVFLGDIGDNPSNRANIKIYRLEEPTGNGGVLSTFSTFTLTYPDGPHNCETLMVDPQTLDIYLVTKVSSGPSAVYRLPYKASGGTYVMTKLGEVNFDTGIPFSALTTGGDFSPDRNYAVVRTYSAAYEFKLKRGDVTNWFSQPRTRVELRLEPQGEAICYSKDGRKLITTSEGSPCEISALTITP